MIIHNAILTGSISMQAPPVISGSLTLTGSINATGDITASSARFSNIITAQTLVVQVVSSSVSYISGSTQFGSSSINTHQFTGSVFISSSATYALDVTGAGRFTGAVTASAFNGAGTGLTSIPNAALSNSTISGISLGNNLAALTIGTGLSGTSYNGSGAVTIANSGVTSIVAGTNISISGATGAVTITNGITNTNQLTNGAGYITSAGLSNYVTLDGTQTITGLKTIDNNLYFADSGTTKRGIQGTVGANDYWFVGGGATATNSGFMEIATGDDAQTAGSSEPIYVRQYGPGTPLTGTLVRTATLLDGSGNTSFPGTVSASTLSATSATITNNLTVSSGNTTGNGIILADDGDIVDLNDAYCSMRFSYGVRIFSANRGGSAVIKLGNGGDIIASADITAYGSPSDINLKENIKPLDNSLSKILKLQGVTFDWKEDSETRQYTNLKEDIGFIAQQVQEVIPELVRKNNNGLLSLRDRGLTALLVEAIKEQQLQIEDLKTIINGLTK